MDDADEAAFVRGVPEAVQGLLDGGTNVKTKNNKCRKAPDLARRNNKLKDPR